MMNLKICRGGGLLATVMASLLLAGCNSSSDADADFSLASFSSDGEALKEVVEAFESETGYRVDVRLYKDGSEDGEEVAIRSGEGADLVDFPQPGRIQGLREDGFLYPLQPEIFNEYSEGLLSEVVTDDSQMYGFPYTFAVKSIVWYSRSAFDDAGVSPPRTYSELESLLLDLKSKTDNSDEAVPDNVWCIGLGDAMSAGDWFEEMLLLTRGFDVYNQWTSGENFSYTDVGVDIEGVLGHWEVDFLGNANSDLDVDPFWDAPRGLLVGQRDCFLHSQASWVTYAFKDSISEESHRLATSADDGDIDFFAFPALPGESSALRRIGGNFLVKVNDNHVVDEFIAFVATNQSRRMIAETGYGKLPNFSSQSNSLVSDAIESDYILNKLNQWYSDNDTSGEVFDGIDLLAPAEGARVENELKTFATTGQSAQETIENLENP